MKINWFSPLPPAPTDIGHFTKRLLPDLSERAEVVLWTEQNAWDRVLENHATVRQYGRGDCPWREMNRADATIYNIGNNSKYHEDIWSVSQRRPGIVILHDWCLQGLFLGIFRQKCHDRDAYLDAMEKYYGDNGIEAGLKLWSDSSRADELANQYPLTPLALENALGIIVHNHLILENLEQRIDLRVKYLALPYGREDNTKVDTFVKLKPKGEPKRLIIFGYIYPNRRLIPILKALAQLEDQNDFVLDIYGTVWDEAEIRKKIWTLGLHDIVTLHGHVVEADLDAALADADLAFNLRYPTMGESSGSELRIWAHELPSAVTDIGWYGALPDACVYKIPHRYEVEGIQRCLKHFLEDPIAFKAMAVAGKKLLKAEHAPSQYVEKLLAYVNHNDSKAWAANKMLMAGLVAAAGWSDNARCLLDRTSVPAAIDYLTGLDR